MTAETSKKTLPAALFVMLLWGLLFSLVKLGYAAYSIVTTGDILLFAGIRFTVCGMGLCLACFCKDKSCFRPVKTALVPILLSGLFAILLHYGFTYVGLATTDSSKTAPLKQVGALFYICLSGLFFKEDCFTVRKLFGAILGFGGILMINFGTAGTQGGLHLHIGDIFILTASFCTVFSNVISKRVFRTVEPLTATGVSQLCGGAALTIIGVLCGGRVSLAANVPLFLLICACSVVSYGLWFIIVKNGSLSKLFIIKFAEPVFASLFGALLLGEDVFKSSYLAAFALISAGIWVSNRTSA